jgi:hypothetical protein
VIVGEGVTLSRGDRATEAHVVGVAEADVATESGWGLRDGEVDV